MSLPKDKTAVESAAPDVVLKELFIAQVGSPIPA